MNVFHMLGKFLYGKRKKLCLNKNKKDKYISEYYSAEDLKTYDPPFYFKPVELF